MQPLRGHVVAPDFGSVRRTEHERCPPVAPGIHSGIHTVDGLVGPTSVGWKSVEVGPVVARKPVDRDRTRLSGRPYPDRDFPCWHRGGIRDGLTPGEAGDSHM